MAKCWWLLENLHHVTDIEEIKRFTNSLIPVKLPGLAEIQRAIEILNRWAGIVERGAGEFFYKANLIVVLTFAICSLRDIF